MRQAQVLIKNNIAKLLLECLLTRKKYYVINGGYEITLNEVQKSYVINRYPDTTHTFDCIIQVNLKDFIDADYNTVLDTVNNNIEFYTKGQKCGS